MMWAYLVEREAFECKGRPFLLKRSINWPFHDKTPRAPLVGSTIEALDMDREEPWPHWKISAFPGVMLSLDEAKGHVQADLKAPAA